MRRRRLLTIFLVALAVRLIHLWQMRTSPFFDVLMGDSRGYDAWAQRIAAGDWIGTEVFYQAPLYPYMLGAIYTVAGHDLNAVRIVQALIGTFASVLLGIAVTRVISPTAGWIAGLGFALYAPAIFFDGLIQKSVLDGFLMCLVLERVSAIVGGGGRGVATAGRRETVNTRRGKASTRRAEESRRDGDEPLPNAGRSRTFTWLTLGIALGLLALTRENALVLVAVVAIWAATGAHAAGEDAIRGRVVALAALAFGLSTVLTPVAVRNAAVGGGFYLTTSQFGSNFYIGNHARADGTYTSLRPGRGAPEFERQDATELAEADLKRTLTPAEVSSYWTGRALAFVREQPGSWLALMGRKLALVWNADEMLDTEAQESHAEWSTPLAVLGVVGHFGVLVPVAVIGMLMLWPVRAGVGIFLALTFAYAASVVLFYVFARYRFPLAPLLMVFAAAAAANLPAVLRSASTAQKQRLATAGIVAAVFSNWPILSPDLMRAITETNLGTALHESGRAPEAIAHYARALQIRSDWAPAANNLGIARVAVGDLAGAIAAFREALRLQPDSAEAKRLLADALYDAGVERLERQSPADAERLLRESIAHQPARAEAHNNLGIALAQQGRVTDAIASWREALRIKPDFQDARRNLELARER